MAKQKPPKKEKDKSKVVRPPEPVPATGQDEIDRIDRQLVELLNQRAAFRRDRRAAPGHAKARTRFG